MSDASFQKIPTLHAHFKRTLFGISRTFPVEIDMEGTFPENIIDSQDPPTFSRPSDLGGAGSRFRAPLTFRVLNHVVVYQKFHRSTLCEIDD